MLHALDADDRGRQAPDYFVSTNIDHDYYVRLRPECPCFGGSDTIKLIAAIFVPPLGVFLERGCHSDFWST